MLVPHHGLGAARFYPHLKVIVFLSSIDEQLEITISLILWVDHRRSLKLGQSQYLKNRQGNVESLMDNKPSRDCLSRDLAANG